MDTPGGWGLFAGWLLKSSAQAALLVVLVLAVQWLLRRWLTTRWRYFLWWLVVARLLMPVSLPGPVSIFNWVKWNSPPAPAMAVMPITPDVALPASPTETVATAIAETTPALPAQSPATIAAPAPTAPMRPPLDWRLAVMWLWLAGAALLGARLVWSVLRLRRELRKASPVDDPTVLALLDDCRERIRVRDRLTLLETPLVNSPALCGFWRPKLLLPPGLCRDFTAQQLRFIFLHELAHVRRHDIAVNWLITLLQFLHWFNPLVWLAFSRLRADRELACDALALSMAAPGEQHAYGQTIIRLLEGFARPSAMPGLVGILEDKSQMKRRIRMIAQFRRPGRWAWLPGIAAAILGIACLTDAQTPKAKEEAKPIIIMIESNRPHIYLNGSPVTKENLQKELTARSASNPDLKIELKVERHAPFRFILDVLDAAKLAKVESVSLHSEKADLPKPSFNDTSTSNANAQAAKLPTNDLKPSAPKNVIDGGSIRSNWGEAGTRHGETVERMGKIRLPRVEFDSVPLSVVIEFLEKQAYQHDPEHRGIKFVQSSFLMPWNSNTNLEFLLKQANERDPERRGAIRVPSSLLKPWNPANTNHQLVLRKGDAVGFLTDLLVTVPGIENATLLEAIEAVVRGANKPIRYSVEDNTVVVVSGSELRPTLYTRWFKVDPDLFTRALAEHGGDGLTNRLPAVEGIAVARPIARLTNAPSLEPERVRRFFASMGIELSPPSQIFYQDRVGLLMVRATDLELELVEKAISSFAAQQREKPTRGPGATLR